MTFCRPFAGRLMPFLSSNPFQHQQVDKAIARKYYQHGIRRQSCNLLLPVVFKLTKPTRLERLVLKLPERGQERESRGLSGARAGQRACMVEGKFTEQLFAASFIHIEQAHDHCAGRRGFCKRD